MGRMSRLRLLPGERELVRLRPSPGAFLPRYLGGLALALWGVLLAFAPGTSAVDEWAILTVAFAGPALAGAALYLPRRRMVRLALCLAAGAAAVVIPIAADGALGWRTLLWLTLATEGLAALLLAETDRRLRRYHLSNLRVLHNGGLWDRRGWTLHYDAILDLDARQTPLGRLLGHGTIEPVLAAEAPQLPKKAVKRRKVVPAVQQPALPGLHPRLWGVRPLPRVRRLVEAFVTDATATEYLRAEQQTQKRVGQAMQDLGRANLLR
jgi:hypothetical protein